MACAQQCAAEYLRNCRRNLVTQMRNLPLIIENLYQQKVFNDHEVDALKAERTEFDKARSILDWVINKGETACYELLRILDATQKRTLDSDLHYWICCFPFRVEDTEISYSTGTKPCQNYQKKLKNKAKNILKDQREHCGKYLGDEGQVNFHFISLVLETDSEGKTPQCKIKWKNKKCKKLRPKKLRAYIPNEEQALSPVDLLRCQDKNILLIGKPGIGKTTVVQEIMRLWAEKDDREFYYMFYFDESVLAHSSRVVNLESIFFDVYLKPKEKDRKDVFQDIEENSENVVIVFDGVVDLEENSTLRKIMKHELLPDAKIIITCRSEVEYDPLFSSWPTRKVYVQGFSEKSISTYYQSMLGHDSVLLDDVLKNQELFSLSHVPMYAFMIVDLIQFKNDNVYNHLHTVTEMYIHIFRVAVKKHGKKKIEEIDMYLKEIKDQIHLLMKNAFSATMQKCLNLPDISSVKKDICHAFLKMITTRDSPTSATTYCAFLHNTMQEFFSALWLLGNPGETEKVLHLCQTEENKHMRHVLPFLCGLLGEHNINLIKCLFPEDQIKKTSDWFIEKFLDTFLQPQSESEVVDLLYVCQCLYELQSPKACLMFLEKMDHQLEPEGDLDPHQCCALSYVIGQSRDKEVYLNLEDCNMTDTGMKMMLRCSPKIRLKIWEDPLKQITFFLEFFHKVSQCSCSFFDLRPRNKPELCDALLDLCSHVKNYETQTGWSFLPVLQSVFQSPDVWIIDLSQRKTSVLLEVLKLQTEKKPVELRGCSEEESEMKSFLQCLPYISQLSFCYTDDEEMKMSAVKFLLNFSVAAVETDTVTGTRFSTLLSSVCSYETFPLNEEWGDDDYQSDFLLDLCSHVKNYETQTGWSFLPVLQSVFQSPDVWIIDLSQRKTSVLLEVLKLQTEKKPVKLRRCSEEESEMKSFLQCLPHISQLRFWFFDKKMKMSAVKFLLNLSVAAVENDTVTGTIFSTLLSSVCSYETFPLDQEWDDYDDDDYQRDFLLDLCSHVKNYETQTGRSFLPALQSVFQLPKIWIIDLSERKTSVLLEVLKLQTEKKPVELRGCSEEESEMMSFLQCLPYISQLRIDYQNRGQAEQFVLKLFIKAGETETQTGEQMLKLLTSVYTYRSFPYEETDRIKQSDLLLDLYSHVKNYETQTGSSFLPALQSVFQSPDVWIIDLSQRKTSVLLEVLKLQTEKKPVELRRCSEEESEMMSFLQCLPYISQLRFSSLRKSVQMQFLLKLFIKAAETETQTGEQMMKLLTSVCTYRSFPYGETDGIKQRDFLLGLYSHVNNYKTQTGRSFLPALQSVFQSPDVWIIDLSQRKTSVLLEVLKLQTEKKPVDLRGCSEEESEIMSFLQCLPYISQLRFSSRSESVHMDFVLKLFIKAAETETQTGEQMLKLLTSVCTYSSFPYGWTDRIKQRDFLLDLCSHVKNYETQTGGSFLPALQSVFQSPDVWIIDLSQRKTSVLLEVLKLQTEKKPVELRGCSEEESEMMSFLQCLPYISQLRIHYKNRGQAEQFLLKLFNKAAETETQTGEQMLKLLTSVCTYSSFPYEKTDRNKQRDFLLDLCSHVKKYETQTALQSVFQSPDVWIIDLSKRKTSVLLKALKLQTVKKPVELRGCLEEEREMMSLLHCLPYISQLRFSISVQNRFILKVFIKAAAFEKQTGKQMLKLLASVCTYSSFPYERTYRIKQRDLLLDLYSHVKNYETQTGRSFLPALQSVFQLPDVWIIDLSQRKTSVLLEVLKLQTEKKPVKLRGCSEEESEMSFLQCLPYISQLRIDNRNIRLAEQFVLKLFIKAAETEIQTGEQMLKLLTSVCTYSSFPYERTYRIKQSDFLLDLYSHVKNYETQTGRSFLPALQSVFQLPDDWIIDLSQRKTSVLLEVLKLQTEKKPVELRGCSEEESEVRSFLQCLPYISQLRFTNVSESVQKRFHLKLLIKAAETETQTGEQMLKLLTSVCAYRSFPYQWTDRIKQRDFLLDLCSHVKNYETQTGGSFLPALQSVFQSPKVWIIDLSQRKTSVLLEVLKLQTEKKPVELRGCSEEESEMKSFLQCLPHISQLSCSERCLLTLVKVVQLRENPDLVTLLLEVLDFSFSLEGSLSSKICRSVGRVLRSSADRLNLTLKPEAISIRGTRLLFRHITHIHTLRLSGYMVVRIVQALRSMRVQTPVTVNELTLDPNDNQLSERKWSRVLSSLAILLRLWTVQCLNLTEYKMESVSLSVLLCHQGPLILRSSKESLQKLVECVCEAQEEELTQHFLQKVGGDLTSCSLSWEELHYFLQHKIQQITVDFRKSNIQCKIREILPFLNRIQFKRLSSSFMLSIMREIYESGSAGFVSSLLSSVKNYISLQSRELDSVHCAALRFTLQHCTAVSLNLLWTSIPEEELESIVPLFRHVSSLSVDRRLLLKMLHCCSVSDVQQEAAAVLLSVLQHKLDFCRSALDLTTNTDSEPLHLTTEDCRVMSTVIQRAHTHTQLIMQDCVINTAGMDQLFPVLRSVKLCCDKSLLLQFLAHVRPEEAVSLSRALGDEVDLSQTHLEPQVCRGLVLILEYSEGLTELDLSQCRLTDHSLDLLLPNLHKAQNIDFSGNSITDIGAQRIYSIVSDNSNIKTVRLFNNRIEFRQLFLTDPRFEIW
ncbi:uncharacterized protein LOC127508489 isoform X5 [Ctenopharyngodon idella]|uniref:uncharacterized protein LOC127508489 isoform X5 n=1 Tax=Ctenopharyngodon idella TaxID=7959 RepID=UPI0022312ED3|nr:uncharacterized protein LOC127508489 isoform X5 [Ctenopharyngodon idella]